MMYHFVADAAIKLTTLLARATGPQQQQQQHTNLQYLKPFQVEAVQFLLNHHEQRTFCVLNDESGLGKTATIAAFLNMLVDKRCLIVVQNDDERLINWQFHLSLLSNLPVIVLNGNLNANNLNYSHACVCLIKWCTLRSMDSPVGACSNFDIVIADNRGEMLSNAFCCATLIKHLDRRVNIVIASTDITSNLKQLHTILRLGDRLEHQYKNYKAFEKKFNLPNIKDIMHKRCNLEEYFTKREIISVYCRDLRLRRYRYQFEQLLPLVDAVAYKTNLHLWQYEQATLSATGVRSTIAEAQNCVVFETETEELLNNFYNEQLAVNEMSMVQQQQQPHYYSPPPSPLRLNDADVIDDDDRMSPLVFLSDSEAEPQVLELQSQMEIIDLTTETEKAPSFVFSETQINQSPPTKAQSVDATRAHGVATIGLQSNDELTTKASNNIIFSLDTLGDDDEGSIEEPFRKSNSKRSKSLAIASKTVPKVKLHRCTNVNVAPLRKTDDISNATTIPEPPQSSAIKSRTAQHKTKNQHGDRDGACIEKRATRSMTMRVTRSNPVKNIYMNVELVLSEQKPKRKSTRRCAKASAITNTNNKNKVQADDNVIALLSQTQETSTASPVTNEQHSKVHKPQKEKDITLHEQRNKNASQIPLISPNYESSTIECAQRLASESSSVTTTTTLTESRFRSSWDEFAVPLIPQNSSTSMMNTQHTADSNIITLTNSPSLTTLSTQSSRLRRAMNFKTNSYAFNKWPTGTNCDMQRNINQSPDLFSNCSDLDALCMQDRSMFSAFGICGMEAKLMQQQSARRNNGAAKCGQHLSYTRSCLAALEKNFTSPHPPDVDDEIASTPSILPEHPSQLKVATLLSQTSSKTGPQHDNRDNGNTTAYPSSASPCKRNKITNYMTITQQIEADEIVDDIVINSPTPTPPEPPTTPKKQKLLIAKTPPTKRSATKSVGRPKRATAGQQSTKLTRWLPLVESHILSQQQQHRRIITPTRRCRRLELV